MNDLRKGRHGTARRTAKFRTKGRIYQEDEALIDIKTLEILEGRLPKRAKALAIEWAIEHWNELMTNWQKARSHETLDRIEPLD